MDPFTVNHPYSEHLLNMVLWTLTLEPATRPTAKELLESAPMKDMRESLLDDLDYIDSYKVSNIKKPVFMPSDKGKLSRRLLAKLDKSYKFAPKEPPHQTGKIV